MTNDERAATKLAGGVVVTDVENGSAADDAGIQPGDVIQEVGGRDVKEASDFAKMLHSAKDQRKHAVLLVSSPNEAPRFVALRLQ
jgi:serine protease Do